MNRLGSHITVRSSLIVAGVIAAVGIVLYVLFLITSDDPAGALQGLLTGAVSNPGRIAQWLSYSSLVMITGAAVCLAFRVGMFSIGAEGQVFIGALVSGVVVLLIGPSPISLFLAVLASAVGGFLWGVVPGLMRAYLGADELVTSLMLNYVATFTFAFVLREYLTPEGAGFPVSEYFDESSWFPNFGTRPAISSTLLLGLIVCAVVSVVLSRTRFGYTLRLVGDSPRFAHANGLPVPRLIWLAIALSGAVAGLAGAALAFGNTHRLVLGMGIGLGFDGILVALLALNRPALVPIAALVYGYIRTGGDVIQITSNVPRDVVVIIQGIAILALAAAIRQRQQKARQVATPTEPMVSVPIQPREMKGV